MGFRAVTSAIFLAGVAVTGSLWAGGVVAPAFAQAGSVVTLPAPGDADTAPSTAPGDASSSDTGAAPAALSAGHCAIWSTSDEDDTGTTNSTATACSSTADDSTAIGVQCPGGTAQIRYYPQTDDLPKGIKRGAKVTMDFGVDIDHVTKVMQYDETNGVFTSALKKAEPLLTLLQSGGPLIVASPEMGSHTFRLVGSTAAIEAVFKGCAHPPAAVPVPQAPLPVPKPRVRAAPNDEGPGYYYYRSPNEAEPAPPRFRRYPPPQRRFFLPFLFGQ